MQEKDSDRKYISCFPSELAKPKRGHESEAMHKSFRIRHWVTKSAGTYACLVIHASTKLSYPWHFGDFFLMFDCVFLVIFSGSNCHNRLFKQIRTQSWYGCLRKYSINNMCAMKTSKCLMTIFMPHITV